VSADIGDDSGDRGAPPESPLEGFAPGERRDNFMVVDFIFPDGKVAFTRDFDIFADHCLTLDEFYADLEFFIGPMYQTFREGSKELEQELTPIIIGTTCGKGTE
jgi:hypothetical protein